MKISHTEVKKGDLLLYEGRPMTVTSATSTCSGRGSRNYLVTMKCIYTGNSTSIKPVGNYTFEKMDISDKSYNYLYHDDSNIYLSHIDTLDQIEIGTKLATHDLLKTINPGARVQVTFNNATGEPISIYLRHNKVD